VRSLDDGELKDSGESAEAVPSFLVSVKVGVHFSAAARKPPSQSLGGQTVPGIWTEQTSSRIGGTGTKLGLATYHHETQPTAIAEILFADD